MEEKGRNGKFLLTGNKQVVKAITKQDIDEVRGQLEQLASWKEPLKLINTFFENQAIPLNKKKIMREFHSQARIFHTFYESFEFSMETLEQKIKILQEKEKIRL